MSKEKFDLPYQSPVLSALLGSDNPLLSQYHQDISSLNACRKNIDIQLTPSDILRLKTRLNINSDEFLPENTYPFEIDAHGLREVGANLKHDEEVAIKLSNHSTN